MKRDLKRYLSYVREIIKRDGWMSGGQAFRLSQLGEKVYATSQIAYSIMISKSEEDFNKKKIGKYSNVDYFIEDEISQSCKDSAEMVIKWLQERDESEFRSDFIKKCIKVAREEEIEYDDKGLAASMFQVFWSNTEWDIGEDLDYDISKRGYGLLE